MRLINNHTYKSLRCIRYCVILLLCLFSFVSRSQEANTLGVKIKFSIKDGGLDNALITITKNGSPYKVIDSKSKYKLDLELGAEYLLTFAKPGYITKSLSIDTHVPNGREKEEFSENIVTVELLKQPEDQEITYTQPVGKFKYDGASGQFDYDKDYSQAAAAMVQKAESHPAPKPKPPAPSPQSTPTPVAVKPPEYKPEPPKPKPVVTTPDIPQKPIVKNKVEKVVQEDRKKITIVTVNIDGVDYVYKKEEYNWGGIYFYKDGKYITENTYNKETE